MPLIDIEASISRVMPNIVDDEHLSEAQRFKKMLSNYRANKDLVTIGAYTKGSDPSLDEAIARHSDLMDFVGQKMGEGASLTESRSMLNDVLNRPLNLQNDQADAQAKMQQG